MAYTTINKSTDYFETTTYTGGATDVSSLSFQPDFVWAKKRDGAENHGLFDAVRGATKTLSSNANSAESTRSGSLTSFDNDGWSMGGSDGIISASGSTYVGWAWKAGGGQGSSNTDGSINTTYTSANTTAGFSISQYTGTGSNATIGHGLSSIPSMIIVKNLSSAYEWGVYHKSLGATQNIYLDLNGAAGSTTFWNNTEPTSSVFNVGSTLYTNGSGNNYIAYCFAEKKGYSKFGSYIGNGSTFDNTFVYTGFKPAFIIIKRTDGGGGTAQWLMMDSKRIGYNQSNYRLYPNLNNSEITTDYIDFLSNGFKIRDSGNDFGASGGSYIYMAFAEAPLVGTNGVTAKAR